MIRWWTVGGLLTFLCSLRGLRADTGVGGIFSSGKRTRFAQTSFSLPEKIPPPPYRRAAQEYPGQPSIRFSSLRASRTLRGQLGAGWYLDFSPEKDVRAKRVLFQEKYRCHPASPPPKPSGYERESNSQSVRQSEPEPPKPDQGQPPPLYATSPVATGAWQSAGFPPGSG